MQTSRDMTYIEIEAFNSHALGSQEVLGMFLSSPEKLLKSWLLMKIMVSALRKMGICRKRFVLN